MINNYNDESHLSLYHTGMFIPEFKGHCEGTYFSIDESGLLLTVFFNKPTNAEIKQFKASHPYNFRLCIKNNVLFILSKFGNLSWMDSSYHPKLSRKEPVLDTVVDGMGFLLSVMLIDCSAGRIESMRIIGLSTIFSQRLKNIVDELKTVEFNKEKYSNDLNYVYRNYSTDDLVSYSSIGCKN